MRLFVFFIFVSLSLNFYTQTFSLDKVVPNFPNEIILAKHSFYEIGYNTKYNLPAWTFYSLTKDHLKLAGLERKGSFKKDPLLDLTQANDKDYASSGLDKGHMVPCEDMSFSETAMSETFYYSNCVPQTADLNRGEWKMLEELCRNWAKEYGEIMVLSGPVLEINLPHIGSNNIAFPKACYKIVLRHSDQAYRSIAFLLPNNTSTLNTLPDYICSIDSVEKLTGLDFFADLPDELEAQFETVSIKDNWNWEYHHHRPKNQKDSMPEIEATQCKAVTKKGIRCKKMTSSPGGFCSLHHK
jgi:endonuclease G, mitochondrial